MRYSSILWVAAISAAALGSMATGPADAQGAWCEANCKALCRKIYGSAGAIQCFAQIPCSDYVGRTCAPDKVVEARYIVYCNANKGKAGTTCR
jgi:hypothetical protein